MTGPSLHIEYELFSEVGIEPWVDTEAYEELLGELSAGVDQPPLPQVHLFPARRWLRKFVEPDEAARERLYDHMYSRARYDIRDRSIYVACTPDAGESNDFWLHETKHWGQDVQGELRPAMRRYKAIAVGGIAVFAGCAAGAVASIYTKNPDIAGVSVPGMIAVPPLLLWYKGVLKVERQASSFQRDLDIIRKYGSILTYEKL